MSALHRHLTDAASGATTAATLDARIVKHLAPAEDSSAFDLNLQLTAGPGITVIVGPSGSGKTMTLNCISGFLRPDAGRILLNDQLYFDAEARVNIPPQHRRCGYIFQDHALFPHMTVQQNLRFAASLASSRSGRLNRYRRIKELLESFELTDLAGRKPAQLSGGQKQRAAIARVLVGEPRILLLDEPARGLDARLRQAFYQLLGSTAELREIPVVLVSHDMEDALAIADSLAFLQHGKLLQSGRKEALLARPANVEVARSLGIFNIAAAEIRALDPGENRGRIRLFNQEIETPYFPGHLLGDTGYACLLRSELSVLPEPPRASVAHHLLLPLAGAARTAAGMRLAFASDFTVDVSERTYERMHGLERLAIDVPSQAVCFVEK